MCSSVPDWWLAFIWAGLSSLIALALLGTPIQNASKTDIESLDKAMGLSKENSFASIFNTAFGFNKSAQQNTELAEQAGEAANYAQNHDFGFTKNQMPEFRKHLDQNYKPEQVSGWMGDINNQNDPEFKQAQSDFVSNNSDMYLDWYRQNASKIKETTGDEIADRTQAVTEGKDTVMSQHKENNKAVEREAQINEDARIMQNLKTRGQPLQSGGVYDYITYKTMNDLGLYQPGVGSKIPEKPKDYQEVVRSPNMDLLDKAKVDISEKSTALLSNKEIKTQEIQQRIDEGSAPIDLNKGVIKQKDWPTLTNTLNKLEKNEPFLKDLVKDRFKK